MADHQDDNQTILNDLKAKIKTLDLNERKKAVALYGIFKQILEEVKAEEATSDAEYNKYNDKTAIITTHMDDIIEGKRAVTEEEINFWKQEDPEYTPDPQNNTAEVIKGFWKGFLVNGDFYVGEHDAPILEHLLHIDAKTDVDEADDSKKIITLSFDFADNEFFENKNLFVKLHSENEEAVRSEASEIKWKNNPTVEKTQKKQKNKRSGQTRVIHKEVQKKSFFEIFNKYEADEDEEGDQKNNEDEDGTMNLYILEETINDILDMMPYALEYYLDVRPDEDEEGKTIEEEDEEDDEDGDEDSDGDDGKRHKFKKSRKNSEHQGNKKQAQAGKPDKENPKQECKQQ